MLASAVPDCDVDQHERRDDRGDERQSLVAITTAPTSKRSRAHGAIAQAAGAG
jgi:hypothetical protein